MSDPISDMLTRIRNAGAAQLPVVKLPHSRIKESAAKILQSEGYVGSTEIPRVRGGLGVAVLSTSEGLMTDVSARKKNLGGELLFYVW